MNRARLYHHLSARPLTAAMLPVHGQGVSPAVGYCVQLTRDLTLIVDGTSQACARGTSITLLPMPSLSGVELKPGDCVSLSGAPGTEHATITTVISGYQTSYRRLWVDSDGAICHATITTPPANGTD